MNFSQPSDFQFVTGDLDKIEIDNNIMPVRSDSSKEQIRGMDIAFLMEAIEERRRAIGLEAKSWTFSRNITIESIYEICDAIDELYESELYHNTNKTSLPLSNSEFSYTIEEYTTENIRRWRAQFRSDFVLLSSDFTRPSFDDVICWSKINELFTAVSRLKQYFVENTVSAWTGERTLETFGSGTFHPIDYYLPAPSSSLVQVEEYLQYSNYRTYGWYAKHTLNQDIFDKQSQISEFSQNFKLRFMVFAFIFYHKRDEGVISRVSNSYHVVNRIFQDNVYQTPSSILSNMEDYLNNYSEMPVPTTKEMPTEHDISPYNMVQNQTTMSLSVADYYCNLRDRTRWD